MKVVKTEEVDTTVDYVSPEQMESGVIYESRDCGSYYIRVATNSYLVLRNGNILGVTLMSGIELRRVPDTKQITISN